MSVKLREMLNPDTTASVELIKGEYSFMYKGSPISSPYKLIVVHLDRDPALRVVIHRENAWTDIRTAMKKEKAIVACLGSFRSNIGTLDYPLGDLVINGVHEKTSCPHFRFFFSILKFNRGFRLRKMKTMSRTVRGVNRNKPFVTYGIPDKEAGYASYAVGGLFGLIWRGKPLPYSNNNHAMGASTSDYKRTALETPQWRAGYGYSKDRKKFFIVTNDESPSRWSITTVRDFFVNELTNIPDLDNHSVNYSVYEAFLPDFGTGTHLFAERGGKLIKINSKAGSMRGIRSGNIVWVMVK